MFSVSYHSRFTNPRLLAAFFFTNSLCNAKLIFWSNLDICSTLCDVVPSTVKFATIRFILWVNVIILHFCMFSSNPFSSHHRTNLSIYSCNVVVSAEHLMIKDFFLLNYLIFMFHTNHRKMWERGSDPKSFLGQLPNAHRIPLTFLSQSRHGAFFLKSMNWTITLNIVYYYRVLTRMK